MTKETFRGKGIGSDMFQFLLNQTKASCITSFRWWEKYL